MDVLAAILTCSLYADDALVRAIVDNAHDNPLAIFTPELDPATGSLSSATETLETATAQLRRITAHGSRALVGLMQIPPVWAAIFRREPQELFDPCVNVSIGTAMLSEFAYACAQSKSRGSAPAKMVVTGSPVSRRGCALRRYAEAIGMPDLSTVVALDIRYQRGPMPVPYGAPILLTLERNTEGSASLFVDERSRRPAP